VVGQVTAAAAAATGLKQGTPVAAGCADLVASAFLAGAVADGDMVLKFGGSGDILLAVAKPLTDPRLYIDHHLVPGLWFSNGCMAASGSLLNWIVRSGAAGEAANARAAGLSVHAWLDRLAAATPAGADGLVLLPYVLGEKTPLHDPHAARHSDRLGCTTASPMFGGRRWRAWRFGFRHHVDIFRERGADMRRIVACDGGAASDLWLQICADVLNRPVSAPPSSSRLLPGAAYVAGVGVGVFKDWQSVGRYVEPGEVFEPDRARAAVYDRDYRGVP